MTISATRSSARRSFSAARTLAACAASIACLVGVGCAGAQQQPTVVSAPTRAQGAVSELQASIRIISDTPTTSLGKQYAEALRWAGVEVVPNVADADVVTELRLMVKKDANGQDVADVALQVRAGQERLATGRINYPLHEQASKEDLSVLTKAVTESPSVRAYAERVAGAKQQTAKAADAAAWEKANAGACAQSPRFSDCSEVIRYLNGFPSGEHRTEAEQALLHAESVRQRASRDAGISRVKADVSAWKAANVEACRAPEAPNACEGVNTYVATYPAGRFAAEAKDLLAQSNAKLNELAEKASIKSAMAQRRVKATTAQR